MKKATGALRLAFSGVPKNFSFAHSVDLFTMISDFDFLLGSWNVVNTRLANWLCDCTDWIEFNSQHVETKLKSGLGNFAVHQYNLGHSLVERSVFRQFNRLNDFWEISRVDAFNPLNMHSLKGTFWHNKGCFLSHAELNEKAVLVWVEWTRICKNYACWEQALSADNGRTWETNWQMEFYRR